VKRLRFKQLLRERNQFSKAGAETLLSVSEYYGVKPRAEAFESGDYETRAATLEGYRIVKIDDLVMNYMLAWKGAYGVSKHDGIVSPAYSVFKVNQNIVDVRYLHHRVRSDDMKAYFRSRSKGIIESRLRLYPDSLLASYVEIPDLATQRQIADFLDRETARIDLLIEKKQRFASGVEDEFLDRVSHLVTLGANENAPRKQSGYAWHPTIPAHWTVTRLKFLCSRIVDCLHETPEHIEDGEYPSIRTSDLIRGSVDVGSAKRVSANEYRHRIQRLEPKECDILYTREGERFGLAALVPPDTKLCLGQRMMMFRTNGRVLPAYLMWSLNGKFAYNFLKQDVTGATSPHLNIFDIRNVPVFLPPIDEQRALVTEIDAFFEKKSQLVEKTFATIDRLKEYRSALITAAVTGQIDVQAYAKSGSTDRQLDAIQEEMGA